MVHRGCDSGSQGTRLRSPEMASLHASASRRAVGHRDLWADAAIAVAIFAASLALLAAGGSAAQHSTGQVDAIGVLLTALSSLPLIARRVAPLPVFVLTATASTVLHGLAQPAGPPLGPTFALYTVAAIGGESRARQKLTLGLTGVLLAAHVSASGIARDAFPGAELLFGPLVWGGAWLAGDRTRLRRERMAELEERALRAERDAERERRLAAAEERARIARELHDSAGHAINVILVHAGLGRLQLKRDPVSAGDAFTTIEEVARETIGEIDQMVRVLREDRSPPASGSAVEPPPGLAALDALIDRHRAAGLRVTTSISGDRSPVSASVDRAAYRILQEALTNAARHGDGSTHLDLSFAHGALEVTVANPVGPGKDPRASGGGHGVTGMRERAALVGGSLETTAHNGRFCLRARLPLAETQT
jgi:signal transduction histidine kinase